MSIERKSVYALIKEYSDPNSTIYLGKDDDINRFENFEVSKEIELFIRVLKQNFPNYVLDNFYRNLESLDVRHSKFFRGGRYNPFTNIITIGNKDTIFHELFHMASTKADSISYVCGFERIHIFLEIINGVKKPIVEYYGRLINEGYTEIMTHRYFDVKLNSYTFSQFLAQKIEEIVGKEDMEKAYLSNGAMILPELLANFNNGSLSVPDFFDDGNNQKSYYSIIRFLNDIDHVLLIIAYIRRFSFSFFDVNKMQKIIKMLVYLYANKLEKELSEGIIDVQEYDTKLRTYFEDFYKIPAYPLELGGEPFIKKYKKEEYNEIYLGKIKEFVDGLILQANNKYSNSIKV